MRTVNLQVVLPIIGFACAASVGCGSNQPTALFDLADAGASEGPDASASDPAADGGDSLDATDSGTNHGENEDTGTGASCYRLTFMGGFNGRVDGDVDQCITSAESSTPVEAIPRSGFTFSSWSDGNTENPRVIAQPEQDATVYAQFETEGLTTVWLGHSFIRWNVELLYDVARNDAGYRLHEDWMTFSGGAGGAPGSLWENAQRRQAGQRMIREQQPDNVVMTFHILPGSSDFEDYANWVDYTLEHVPNARFYISLPWRSSPFGNAQFDPVIDENGGEDLEAWYVNDLFPYFVRTVLSQLRTNYPDSEFIIIPQVIAADQITKSHFAGTLTYGPNQQSLLIRNPKGGMLHEHEQSIYDDGTGHPGGPLRLLTMILYLRYIYGFQTDSYEFWESKQSFSNLGLQGIGPKETFDVPYLYYNGFDFPVVADDIFNRFGKGD